MNIIERAKQKFKLLYWYTSKYLYRHLSKLKILLISKYNIIKLS